MIRFLSPLRNIGARLRAADNCSISAEEYARRYESWGGSFILHPEVLQFLSDVHSIKTDYRGYFENDECVGAVPVWGSAIAGDHRALLRKGMTERIDFGYPVIHLPIAPGHRCRVRYQSGFLLNRQRTQISGAVFPGLKRMAILKRIPDELTSGKKEFLMKERRFQRLGGTARDIREFTPAEVTAIYTELFKQRWGRQPHALEAMNATFERLGKFLFGKVLWVKDHAIAIQINYRADTSRTIAIDYINGGVDKSLNEISPGSLLSYINGRNACAEAELSGKELIYSYGKANTAYKDQWCHRVARGFSGYAIP